ncbi:MAG: PKD domain-containing protein [Bacteroidota bacterium]
MKRAFTTFGCILITFQLYGQVSNFPYVENFESFSNCQAACGQECFLTNDWVNSQTDDTDWIVAQGPTETILTGPSTDWNPGTGTGKYVYLEASGGCAGSKTASLVSPYFNFSQISTPVLRFAYHMFGQNMGTLHLDVDTSGTWVNDWIPPLTSNQDRWQFQELLLTQIVGKNNVRFRFRGTTGDGVASDIALDDIRVREAYAYDVAVNKLVQQDCGLSDQEFVSVWVSNNGSNTVQGVSLWVSSDRNSAPLQEVFNDTLEPGENKLLTFTQPFDLSAYGKHRIKVAIAPQGIQDSNPLNDTLRKNLLSAGLIKEFPYREGFEKSSGGWLPGGTNSSWEWGVPQGSVINQAAERQSAWVTNLSGNYNNNESSILESPCFDFTELTADPVLSFAFTYDLEACCDQAWIEYSLDAGEHWQKLGSSSTGFEGWYNDGANQWWDGKSNSWNQSAHPLTGLAGHVVRLRFVVRTDPSIAKEGLGIDEVQIRMETDLQVAAIESPQDSCGGKFSSNATLKVRYRNLGYRTIQAASTSFSINGLPFSSPEMLPARLKPNDEISYSFAAKADFSAIGTYQVIVVAGAPGDVDNQNNTLRSSIGNHPNPVVDLGSDTTACANSVVRLASPVQGTTYQWSNGATTSLIDVRKSGDYLLEVIDNNGCAGQDLIRVDFHPEVFLQPLSLKNVSCYGRKDGEMSVSLSGGVAPLHLSWAHGAGGNQLKGLPGGTYFPTVEDATGCMYALTPQTIFEPDSLLITLDTLQEAGCPADSTGFIKVQVSGGNTPYKYEWSDGVLVEDRSKLAEGHYQLQVIDRKGCEATSPIYDVETRDILPVASFDFTVTGGTVHFMPQTFNTRSFTWHFGDGTQDVEATEPSYTYQENGHYRVMLIASNSCGSDTTVKLIHLKSVSIDNAFEQAQFEVFPNPVSPGNGPYFQFSGNKQLELTFSLYDLGGKQLWHQGTSSYGPSNAHELAIPVLSKGVYLLYCLNDGNRAVYRLMVE